MIESDFKALTVGPDDVLFITMITDDVKTDNIATFQKQLLTIRPDLKDRVFILAAQNGIDMAVVKKSEINHDKGKT